MVQTLKCAVYSVQCQVGSGPYKCGLWIVQFRLCSLEFKRLFSSHIFCCCHCVAGLSKNSSLKKKKFQARRL